MHVEHLAYLLKYDSVHGKFQGTIEIINGNLVINGNEINISHLKSTIKKYNKDIRLHTLVVKPSFGCSTKYIYSKVKIYSKPQFNSPKSKMFEVKCLKMFNNDLENIAFKKYPQLKKIKSFLSNMPNNIFARMSGSGSSIVAYFLSKSACNKAYSLVS